MGGPPLWMRDRAAITKTFEMILDGRKYVAKVFMTKPYEMTYYNLIKDLNDDPLKDAKKYHGNELKVDKIEIFEIPELKLVKEI